MGNSTSNLQKFPLLARDRRYAARCYAWKNVVNETTTNKRLPKETPRMCVVPGLHVPKIAQAVRTVPFWDNRNQE